MAVSKIPNRPLSNNTEVYAFPTSAASVSNNNDQYTAQHNGSAIIKVSFGSGAYSQIGFTVNGKDVAGGYINTGGAVLEGLSTYLSFSVTAGDVIKTRYNGVQTVNSAIVTILY